MELNPMIRHAALFRVNPNQRLLQSFERQAYSTLFSRPPAAMRAIAVDRCGVETVNSPRSGTGDAGTSQVNAIGVDP
jgi:hypothetical protein